MLHNKKIYILIIVFLILFKLAGNFVNAAPNDPLGCCVYKKITTSPATVFTIYKTSSEVNCKDESPNKDNGNATIKKISWTKGQQAMGTKCVTDKTKNDIEYSAKNEKTIFTPEISIPGSNFQSGANLELPDSTGMLADYIIAILKYSIGLIGIIATVVLMFAGARWLTAGGNQSIIGSAKTYIVSSLSGLVLTMGSFLLLSMVSTSLTTLNITKINRIQYISLQVGCCEKTGQDGKVTTENTPKDMCKAENMPGYTNLSYKGEDYGAEGNKCVLITGCCYVRSKNKFLGITVPFTVRDKMCLTGIKEKECSDRETPMWKQITKFAMGPLGALFASVYTDFNKGKDCSQVSDCDGDNIPKCKDYVNCLNTLKQMNK